MPKYNYKMTVVNPDKNIVALSPTAGTYAKAFMPAVVLSIVLWAVGVLIQRRELAAFNETVQDEILDPAE